METQIGEKIAVACFFNGGKARPFCFWWRKRRYKVLEVAFVYVRGEGREKIWCFSVRGEGGWFEISFNQETFDWRLEKVLGG